MATGLKEGNTLGREPRKTPIERWHIIGERHLDVGKKVRREIKKGKLGQRIYEICRISDKGMIILREEGSLSMRGRAAEPTSVALYDENEAFES